jgi:hypothetical protein
MKKYIFILMFLSITFAYTKDDPKAAEAMKNIVSKLQSHNSLSADIVYRIKPLFTKIFDVYKGKVDLIRRTDDKNFGVYFWYALADTLDKYYDGNKYYSINHKTKELTYYSKGDIGEFYQDTDCELIHIPFIAPNALLSLVNSDNNLSIKNFKGNKNLKVITVIYPDENQFKNQKMEIIFNQTNFDIVKIISIGEFRNSEQINEWNLSNIVYDKVNENTLKSEFNKFSNYKQIKFVKPNNVNNGN